MSFAVWNEKPPFDFAEDDAEQIYIVGDKFIVTNDPLRATQEEIDAQRSQSIVVIPDSIKLKKLLHFIAQLPNAPQEIKDLNGD